MMRMIKFVSIGISVLFCGCATKIEYKEVYIPQKCDVVYPSKGNKPHSIEDKTRSLIIYTKKLEKALDCCVKGECS